MSLKTFLSFNRTASILILGAPFEKQWLSEVENSISHLSSRIYFATADLTQAYQILQNADALLTCDTSIKHLAALAKRHQ
ncbi:MAG: hypothetical protein R2827_09420 [Bdellovibrionales bacterium]